MTALLAMAILAFAAGPASARPRGGGGGGRGGGGGFRGGGGGGFRGGGGGFRGGGFRGGGFRGGAIRGGVYRGSAIRSGAIRSGAIRSGAIRSGAIRSGAIRSSAFRGGAFRGGVFRGAGFRNGWRRYGYWWPFGLGFGYGYWPYWGGYWGGDGYGWPSYGYGYGYPAYSATYPYWDYDDTWGLLTENEPVVPSNYPPATGEEDANLPDNRARLVVDVPANAQVWVSGERTSATGPVREFHSPPLTPGKDYVYTIRARWMTNSGPRDQTRKVRVRANEVIEVDFTTASAPQKLRTLPTER
jgi:uncharacterized protein (TIGR03000 family)